MADFATDNLALSVQDEIKNVKFGRPHVVILGAGASLAAFPKGDVKGLKLPLMIDFVNVLDLAPDLERHKIKHIGRNFEEIYSDLYEQESYRILVQTIEKRVFSYFSQMRLPDAPTIYDHLVLSLREKDLIATFNWDPFLYLSCMRNYKMATLPHVVYLHGNVAVGYCLKDRTKGLLGQNCSVCKGPYTPSKLLFPIKKKDYASDAFISTEWSNLREYLKRAYMLTIFGYSAPKSDVEAIKIMKDAWGSVHIRNLEEIEIIDIKPEDEVRETWSDFIHTHHYTTCGNFYDSFIANHPRRTCEAMWDQLMECKFISDNKIPKDYPMRELHGWFQPLLAVEKAHAKK